MRATLAVALPGLLACQPATTRPTFAPLPEAETVEIRISPLDATKRLAEVMQTESIPAERVELRDGFIESRWFDHSSGKPTAHRPMGTRIVRVRAWADPGRPGYSLLTVETVYRPLADPSLPPRELEREVPKDHPVAAKVHAALEDMLKGYGGPPVTAPAQQGARPGEEPAPEPDDETPAEPD
ncbi:MAG TPA: hypothetical protein VIG08_06150 [Gemmatimonadales bacterium]|jgi:hypothetical protein